MAIKVNFPTGVDTVTSTKKLHQWDYGQQLEIEAVDLSPIIEVHFACQGMSEAEVRPCTTTNGIATVDIPDRCLEQTTNITAWVFEINGTRGMTTKTIIIPVIARTKPSKSEEIPQEFKDCYTELISEVNEAIRVLESGDVVAKYASSAGSASSANTAGRANTAGSADSTSSLISVELESNTDLNTLKDTLTAQNKEFFSPSYNISTTLINCPTRYAFTMSVKFAGDCVVQEVTEAGVNKPKKYHRTYNSFSGNWSEWTSFGYAPSKVTKLTSQGYYYIELHLWSGAVEYDVTYSLGLVYWDGSSSTIIPSFEVGGYTYYCEVWYDGELRYDCRNNTGELVDPYQTEFKVYGF